MIPNISGRTLDTTETTLEVLETVMRLDGARMAEIADHLGMAESTVHSHLNTLRKHHYVTKTGDVYQLGLKLFNVGQRARYRDPRYRVAKNEAQRLAGQVNEEVNFSMAEHGRVVTLFDEVDNTAIEGIQVGEIFYMHNTASGKSILAELPKQRVEEIINYWGLPATQENTVTDREELFEELQRTRERGYAVNRQETIEGLRAIGMAILNSDGSVFGAIDISGAPYRLQDGEQLISKLSATVENIEQEIANGLDVEEFRSRQLGQIE
jgi:DNA-binding IclR family transcriptional regulator